MGFEAREDWIGVIAASSSWGSTPMPRWPSGPHSSVLSRTRSGGPGAHPEALKNLRGVSPYASNLLPEAGASAFCLRLQCRSFLFYQFCFALGARTSQRTSPRGATE